MSEREYKGDPLDLTYQSITERSDGETVDATPKKRGKVTTDAEGGTDLSTQIIEYGMKNPNASVRDIAEQVGCSSTYAWRVITRQSDVERYEKDSLDELTDKAAKIVWIRAAAPDKSQKQICEQVGVSEAYVSKVLNSNSHLVEVARKEIPTVES